jgi:hypothetical protein
VLNSYGQTELGEVARWTSRDVRECSCAATSPRAREKFTLVPVGPGGWYAIQTIDGHYLTAVDSGGRTTDTVHSNATQIQAWEEFQFICS